MVLADHEWVERLGDLVAAFGAANVVAEYAVTLTPEDADHHAALDRALAARAGDPHAAAPQPAVRAIVSARPAAATRHEAGLAAAKQALARRQSVPDAEPELHPMGAPWLRSGAQIARMVPGHPELIAAAADLAAECAFGLNLVAPNLPDFPTPPGHTEESWLKQLTWQRARTRYASRSQAVRDAARRQIEHELEVIARLGFPATSSLLMTSSAFVASRTSCARGAVPPLTRRSASPWASPTPSRSARDCSSSASYPQSATVRPIST